MKFDITPEQVISGQVNYDFPRFRQELRAEVQKFVDTNKPEENTDNKEKMVAFLMNLQFDVYYWSALGNELTALVEFFKQQDPNTLIDLKFLQGIQSEGIEAIKMLKAIFIKKLQDHLQDGLAEEAAAAKLDEYIKETLKAEQPTENPAA